MGTTNNSIKLTGEEKSYIAGFLDGDGSIVAQIVKGKGYRFGFTIRVSVIFFQKASKEWFMIWLKSKLKFGYIRTRPDGMVEYTITGFSSVKTVLLLLKDHLRLKHELAKLVLRIIDANGLVSTAEGFLALCELVDRTVVYTYSKRRKIGAAMVRKALNFPVET